MLAADYVILMQIKWTGVFHHIKNYGCYIMGVLQVSSKSLNDYTLKKERFSLHKKGMFFLCCVLLFLSFFTLTEH